MGKKRKASSDSDEDDKKKKKDGKKKKKKEKKSKKDKKKKKEKKGKKKESSSSDSSDSGSEAEHGAEAAALKEAGVLLPPPKQSLELQPPEEGIKRFEYTAEEVGPLGVRFSGGFPPLILAVNPGSFAEKKGVPVNFEVHAVNGLALVPQNHEEVMNGLKSRPVVLDVRPQGWMPKEKLKERERKREREEAEQAVRVKAEEQRRQQVAKEAAEQAEREAAELAERKELERIETEALQKKAREARAVQRAKEEEFERSIISDPEELRQAANALMEADYGSSVNLEGTGRKRGLPLRLMTRRKEVAWLWAGEVQELIGGGVPDSTWS